MLKVAPNSADHRQGSAGAGIVLVEYGDFECPHCGHAYPLVKKLLTEWGRDILFVYRHFPLTNIHPNAIDAALAAEAAGKQEKFWEMHERIFQHQDKLSDQHFLLSSAYMIGLEPGQFESDLKSEAVKDKVESDFDSGLRSGVNGTPAFFLNSKPLISYDGTYESLVEAIQVAAVTAR